MKTKLLEITDIGLASTLVVKGYKIQNLKTKGKYIVFSFQDDGKLYNLIEAYYKDDILVPPKRLFQEYKTLKQAKFTMLKGEENGEKFLTNLDTE